ncbi:GNAT family N-acetyltransferase [Pseudoclavibacter alba]|uniref:GNAT family N-acetyltransferase n=1 Tax=Pseudoclavibacter albus TaxID=272241 RepID=UPI0019CFFB14|nr:GNAT family N-acetyltransferase [Pseudoclavibacter alba]MBN6778555.1 GNAT family N-acetyltransferase [Pseudoclavibacter alba]
MTNATSIRHIAAGDRTEWERLYAGYCDFSDAAPDEAARDRLFSWFLDENASMRCLVAEGEDGGLLGFANYTPYRRTVTATIGIYLDDLYVSPEARGSGVADAIFHALRDIALENGWTLIRWITQDDNYRARSKYDRLATRTHWITYDMDPNAPIDD